MMGKMFSQGRMFTLALVLCLTGVFAFGTPSGARAGELAVSAAFAKYAIKEGKVYNGTEEVACELREAPSGLDMAIAYWTTTDGAVLFFAKDGAIIADISDEDLGLGGLVDIAWSMDGSRLVLVDASGVRNFYVNAYIYGKGMKREKGDITTLREDGFFWIDGTRLVFTQVGALREGGAFPMNDVKLSVALYDAATGETTLLKEASDKHNFVFSSVSDDGEEITITEFSVTAPDDWADEEKTKTRDITIPVPAAG